MTLIPKTASGPLSGSQPGVDFAVGIAHDHRLHAVERERAKRAGNNSARHAPAACGTPVLVASKWGSFERGNARVDRQDLCEHCAWTVALARDTADAELAALAPTGSELAALQRLMPDALAVVKVVQQLLDDRRQEIGADADHPSWAQRLAYITAHRPLLLVDEDCADGSCEHQGDCYDRSTTVACPSCSLRAGSWEGEWEGQLEVVVPAPCSVLATAASQRLGTADDPASLPPGTWLSGGGVYALRWFTHPESDYDATRPWLILGPWGLDEQSVPHERIRGWNVLPGTPNFGGAR